MEKAHMLRTILQCRTCLKMISSRKYSQCFISKPQENKLFRKSLKFDQFRMDLHVGLGSATYQRNVGGTNTAGPYFSQRRHFSRESMAYYFSSDFPPVSYAQDVFTYTHNTLGLPWWASIPITVFGMRALTTLPLSIYVHYILAKVQCLEPELKQLAAELKMEVAVAIKKSGWTERVARSQFNRNMKRLQRELFIRDNCHPLKSTIIAWVQIPMWVSLSLALRNMSGAFQINAEGQPGYCPELGSEGMLWFSNMLVPDATYILPILMGVVNLTIIEMNVLKPDHTPRMTQKIITNLFRFLTIFLIPIAASMPSCMSYYWTCSSLFGLGQNILLKFPSIRRACRIPKTVSESQTPFQDMLTAGKDKYGFLHRIKKS